ncbi:MAG: EAL domain-containing protein [Xanthobacteraceae bacterium]|nr:MAG: EAL domain-containing protein [Xanthobacteraceae bacterium]
MPPDQPIKKRLASVSRGPRARDTQRPGPVAGLSALPQLPEGCEACQDAHVVAAQNAYLSCARLHEAFDMLPEGLVLLDSEGRHVLWNKSYAEIYSGSADLLQPGMTFEEALRAGVARGEYPEAAGRVEEWIGDRVARLRHPGEQHELSLANGHRILVDERVTSENSVVGLHVDITGLMHREKSFRLLFDDNPLPMFVCAADDGRIVAINDAALAHYGYSREDFLAKTLGDIQSPAAGMPWSAGQTDEERAARTWRHVKADGGLIDVAVYSREMPYEGRPAVMLAMVDITERKEAEARAAFLAQHDPLTGLPNRASLRQRAEDILAVTRRSGQKVAALCIDIDDFQAVNDTLGPSLGDELLLAVAERLRTTMREEDFLARIGGDEFIALQAGIDRPEQVAILAKRLMSRISEPYRIDGKSAVISVSIGIAMAPGDGNSADVLLKNAEMALTLTKNNGRGMFRFFEPAMDARAQLRRRLEMKLRAAIDDSVLEPHYQPLVDLRSGRITGFEALARWPDAERGFIPPSEFIPVAEDTGLISALGVKILRRACLDAAGWPDHVNVAVNLSPVQFSSGGLFAVVLETLRDTGLPARRLQLEITETLLLEKSEQVVATLHALRALGVSICMDDFGTGYSSLSYLRSFPFDKIKIDRSFVQDLDSNPDAQAIIRAIVSLGGGLGITVTAEGIETQAELKRLRLEGCHEGQGFLFSRALPNADIVSLLCAQQSAGAPRSAVA